MCPWQVTAYPFAYVANGDGRTLIVDTSTRRVADAIPAGVPVGTIAPDGETSYSLGATGVLVSNLRTKAVAATIPVPGAVDSMVMHPYGTRLYVLSMTGAENWTIFIVDTSRREIVATITDPSWGGFQEEPSPLKVITPDGFFIWYGGGYKNASGWVDTRVNEVFPGSICGPPGLCIGDMVASTDGKHVYYGDYEGSIHVKAVAGFPDAGVSRPPPPGTLAGGSIAASPNGKVLMASFSASGAAPSDEFFMEAIDSRSLTTLARIRPAPDAIAVTPDGRWAYAGYRAGNMLKVFDTINWRESGTIRDTRLTNPGTITMTPMMLRCSPDRRMDGRDRSCVDGLFLSSVRSYLWPAGPIQRVDFYLDGQFHRTVRSAPWALNGGSGRLPTGPHEVRAFVRFRDGSRPMTISATFDIDKPPLRCSADRVLNDQDVPCEGRTFPGSRWIHWWPQTGVKSVDFYLDGVFHRTDRKAPFEFDGGAATHLPQGTHEIRSVVVFNDGREPLTVNTTVSSSTR